MDSRFVRRPQLFFSAVFWMTVSALSLFGAVYYRYFAEGDRPGYSLAFVLVALIACIAGILLSSRQSEYAEGVARETPWMKKIVFVAMAIHLVTAVAVVRTMPGNVIDVFNMNEAATRALLHGINPYTLTQVNIYNERDTQRFYPPGLVVNSRVQVGYPYPPVCLFSDIPGYVLGDVRYSSIAAILLSAFLMVSMRVTRVTTGLACLLLLNPITFIIERFGWVDPFVLLPLSATLYAAVKRRWWLPVALGIFFVSKQYAVLGIPFVVLLEADWKRAAKLLVQALGVSVAVTAPLALWDIRHYVHDTVLFQILSPFRADSLSFAVFFPVLLKMVGVILAGATLWALIVAKRHPAMFACCYGLVLLLFVCLNKQAFINYYFLVAQSIWLGVAAWGIPVGAPEAEMAEAERQVEAMSAG